MYKKHSRISFSTDGHKNGNGSEFLGNALFSSIDIEELLTTMTHPQLA